MNKTLKYAMIAGIVEIVFFIPLLFLSLLRYFNKFGSDLLPVYILVNLIALSAFIIFIWGLKIIAEKYQNNLLKSMIYIAIVFNTLTVGFTILSVSHPRFMSTPVDILLLMIEGIISILIGVGLLRLKPQFGAMARAAGTLDILSGICGVTIVLSPVSVLLSIAASIFIILILLNEVEGIKKEDKPLLKKIPLGINIVSVLLILPTLLGLFSLSVNTSMLNATDQQKLEIIKRGGYDKKMNITSIDKFDNYAKEFPKRVLSPWALFVSCAQLILIFGLNNFKEWARKGVIVYSGFVILFALVVMFLAVNAVNAARLGALIQTVQSGAIIYYFSRPKVKGYFENKIPS